MITTIPPEQRIEPNRLPSVCFGALQGHGTLNATVFGQPGLLRHGHIVELGRSGDCREWLCVLEATGVILLAKARVTELEAMAQGHLPSFWARLYRDAFQAMVDEAETIEGAHHPDRKSLTPTP